MHATLVDNRQCDADKQHDDDNNNDNNDNNDNNEGNNKRCVQILLSFLLSVLLLRSPFAGGACQKAWEQVRRRRAGGVPG